MGNENGKGGRRAPGGNAVRGTCSDVFSSDRRSVIVADKKMFFGTVNTFRVTIVRSDLLVSVEVYIFSYCVTVISSAALTR